MTNPILFIFRKLIAICIAVLTSAHCLLNYLLKRQPKIGELPVSFRKLHKDSFESGVTMESIDEGLEVTVIQDKCKGNSLNGANYDYQRQAMLANQKKLEEGMRLKEIHYQKELAEKEALACAEQDYFKDMAPKIKIKKINVIKKVQETAKKSDLFLIQEKDSDVPEISAILGDLDESCQDNLVDQNAWDDEIDMDDVDKVDRDFKRKERECKHKQRLQDHQKKIAEKKFGL